MVTNTRYADPIVTTAEEFTSMTHVLVVDDSPVDRRLAGGLLEKHDDFEVAYAENGNDALRQLEQRVPDLVVTDLQMPELNGLELVGFIRSTHPLVPVILMTAHGSEDIAVEALEQGASSYVPKSKLADNLLDTVANVLALASAGRQQERLQESMTFIEAHFEIGNDPALVPPLVQDLQHLVTRMGLCDETSRIRVGVAVEEALLNAIYHGNLELTTEELADASANLLQEDAADVIHERKQKPPYNERRLYIQTKITPQEALFTIRDEGPGFDPSALVDPADPTGLQREGGRGLVLMRTFMDETRFNDAGNEVTLVKRRDATDEPRT